MNFLNQNLKTTMIESKIVLEVDKIFQFKISLKFFQFLKKINLTRFL